MDFIAEDLQALLTFDVKAISKARGRTNADRRGSSLSVVLDLKAIRAVQLEPLTLMTVVDIVSTMFQTFGWKHGGAR
jgi:hypothetical protein